MTALARFAVLEIFVLLAGSAALLLYKALTGSIRLHGLLDDKNTGRFSPERAQLLVFTFITVVIALSSLDEGIASRSITVPHEAMLYVLGGSQGTYLLAKFLRTRG